MAGGRHLYQRIPQQRTWPGRRLPLPEDGDPTLVRELQAARREVAEVKKEAEVALAFHKSLVDRLTSELEQASERDCPRVQPREERGKTCHALLRKKSSKSREAWQRGVEVRKAITERRVEFFGLRHRHKARLDKEQVRDDWKAQRRFDPSLIHPFVCEAHPSCSTSFIVR